MKITKKFIKENADKTFKEVFPEVFEEDNVILEVGNNWYKSISEYGSLFQYIGKNKVRGFFRGYDWTNEWSWSRTIKCRLATEQEVFEALKNEAVKRYCNGNYLESVELKNEFMFDGDIKFKHGLLYCNGNTLFAHGKWAKVLEPITKEEAEKQLGRKII